MERAKHENRLVTEIQEDELVKLAQIPMHQAIQIATAQLPGTVVECRLRGSRVEDFSGQTLELWEYVISSRTTSGYVPQKGERVPTLV